MQVGKCNLQNHHRTSLCTGIFRPFKCRQIIMHQLMWCFVCVIGGWRAGLKADTKARYTLRGSKTIMRRFGRASKRDMTLPTINQYTFQTGVKMFKTHEHTLAAMDTRYSACYANFHFSFSIITLNPIADFKRYLLIKSPNFRVHIFGYIISLLWKELKFKLGSCLDLTRWNRTEREREKE